MPAWKAGDGILYNDKASGTVFGWSVPVPAGDIEGELILKDETFQVKGHGYHDHNWGNCYMHTLFDNWYWGRIHDENFSIDYARVQPRNSRMPLINPLLIATQDEIVLSTNMLKVELLDEKTDDVYGRSYANRLKLSVEAEGVSADIDINSRRIAERLVLPATADRQQHYYRFIADYTMTVIKDGATRQSSGELLHELVLL